MPGIIPGWTLMAVMFIRELDLSVILARSGTEVLSVPMYRAVHDALWGTVATIGIMIAVNNVDSADEHRGVAVQYGGALSGVWGRFVVAEIAWGVTLGAKK